jgi:hypothetical protein
MEAYSSDGIGTNSSSDNRINFASHIQQRHRHRHNNIRNTFELQLSNSLRDLSPKDKNIIHTLQYMNYVRVLKDVVLESKRKFVSLIAKATYILNIKYIHNIRRWNNGEGSNATDIPTNTTTTNTTTKFPFENNDYYYYEDDDNYDDDDYDVVASVLRARPDLSDTYVKIKNVYDEYLLEAVAAEAGRKEAIETDILSSRIFGYYIWPYLHSTAHLVDLTGNDDIVEAFKKIVMSIEYFIPCGICHKHFSKEKWRLEMYYYKYGSMASSMHLFHAFVNARALMRNDAAIDPATYIALYGFQIPPQTDVTKD